MAIRVTTATLIRGKVYTLRHPDHTPANPRDSLRFEAGVPVEIKEQKIITLLENMSDEVGDGDGEYYDKPVFRIDRGVEAPDAARPRATKLEPDRVIRKRPMKRA